jgi:hypothetical protein
MKAWLQATTLLTIPLPFLSRFYFSSDIERSATPLVISPSRFEPLNIPLPLRWVETTRLATGYNMC